MKNWLLVITLLFSTLAAWADTKEFVRDYTYKAGEADSKISARQMAMQEVKRELLNEIGTHIYSRIEMTQNSTGETDAKEEIRAMTAGFVKVVVVEESWNGYEFYIKAKMAADPTEILERIKGLASNDDENIKLKKQLTQSAKEFEDLRLEMLALKRALDNSQSRQETQKLAVEYANASKGLSVAELYEKGQDYYWGYKGKSVDYYESIKWYQKASDQGHAEAQFSLATMYENAKGTAKDYKQAVYWYIKSAEQGHKIAQSNLGTMYKDGTGIKQDYKKALYWYQKAVDQGHITAQFNMGIMHKQGLGVPQDYKKALYWYQMAADNGQAGAQSNLGLLYSRGEGVTQSDKMAVYWYQKSAEQGHKVAQFNLGIRYGNGKGISKDYSKKAYWYQKSADQGYAKAQYYLGVMYSKGLGVEKDQERAIYWYQKAADQDFKTAIAMLKKLN